MKTRIIFWLAAELVLAAAVSSCMCILRHDEKLAYRAWRENPNTVTLTELDTQRWITFRHHVVLGGVLWLVMAAATVPVIRAMYGQNPKNQID